MNSKTIVAALLAGLTLFLLGGLFYVLLLGDFFETPVSKDPPGFLFIILGELVGGILLAWVLSRFGTSAADAGAKDGAMFGFLLFLALGLIMHGAYDISALSVYMVDVVISTVRFAVAGAVAGWWLGRGASTTSYSAPDMGTGDEVPAM